MSKLLRPIYYRYLVTLTEIMLKWLVILKIKSFILFSSLFLFCSPTFLTLPSIISPPDVPKEQGMCGASSELDNLAVIRATWMERRKRKIQLDFDHIIDINDLHLLQFPTLLTTINFNPFYAECVALAHCRYTIFPIGDTFISKPLVWCLF